MAVIPVLCVFLPVMIGLTIGTMLSRRHAAGRARWREEYRKSPEANLIRLK
jgi:hypothetical protein